eukprot:610983-Rhodomonas_salina.3
MSPPADGKTVGCNVETTGSSNTNAGAQAKNVVVQLTAVSEIHVVLVQSDPPMTPIWPVSAPPKS